MPTTGFETVLYTTSGPVAAQELGGILDGLMRNTPDALNFIQTAETEVSGRQSNVATDRSATTAGTAGVTARSVARHHALRQLQRRAACP
jgi:hypothetical protein